MDWQRAACAYGHGCIPRSVNVNVCAHLSAAAATLRCPLVSWVSSERGRLAILTGSDRRPAGGGRWRRGGDGGCGCVERGAAVLRLWDTQNERRGGPIAGLARQAEEQRCQLVRMWLEPSVRVFQRQKDLVGATGRRLGLANGVVQELAAGARRRTLALQILPRSAVGMNRSHS